MNRTLVELARTMRAATDLPEFLWEEAPRIRSTRLGTPPRPENPTQNVASRNFRFLSPPETQSPPEEIEVSPDTLREGELRGVTPDAGIQGLRGSVRESDAHDPNAKPEGGQDEGTPHWQPNLKRKRVNEAPESESDSPRRTRGRRVDYHHLNNPFSDDEDEDINVVADISDEAFSVAANDGAASLKEANSKIWELGDL